MKNNDGFRIRWRFSKIRQRGEGGGVARYTPTSKRWENVHVKAVRKVGRTKKAIVDNARYIINQDSTSIKLGKEDLVGTIGNPVEFAKGISEEYDHYRVIISPKRGDLLDMKLFIKNVIKEVEVEIGMKMDYVAAIHKPAEPNKSGIYNQHAHLILKGGHGKGSSWLVPMFREAATREATRQIELGIVTKQKELEISKEHIVIQHRDIKVRHD